MYTFKKLDLKNIAESPFRKRVLEFVKGDIEKNFYNRFIEGFECINARFKSVLGLFLKHKNLLFDKKFCDLELENDDFSSYMALFRIFEIIYETKENFWLLEDENGKFGGFFYLYDFTSQKIPKIISEKNNIKRIEYIQTVTTACLTGCLKKDFWGQKSAKAFLQALNLIFSNTDIKKIKCEIFASNPYVKGILKRLHFRCEGVLKNETVCRNKLETVEIWSITKDEHNLKNQ